MFVRLFVCPPPSPALTSALFIPFSLLVCVFRTRFHRGQAEREHEYDIPGGGGEVPAGERAEHSPGRLLETQRLQTSLEGKRDGRDAAAAPRASIAGV